MYLDEKQKKRADNFYNVLKNFMVMKPDDFIDSGIKICKDCNGNGLGGVWKHENIDDYAWDTSSYCETCYGVGFINFEKKYNALSDEVFICNKCQGVGCINCNGTGMVDWIGNIMGR